MASTPPVPAEPDELPDDLPPLPGQPEQPPDPDPVAL
jgi:hypothetical protein